MMNRLLGLLLCLFIAISTQAIAQQKYSAVTPNGFMKQACVRMRVDMSGLKNLIKNLKAILEALNGFNLSLGAINADLNPPTSCLPDLGLNINIPGLDGLLGCVQGLMPQVDVRLPNLSATESCLSGMVPSVRLPNINPDAIMACLGNIVNIDIDLPSLSIDLARIVRAIQATIRSLTKILPKLELTLRDLIPALNWMVTFCRRNYGINIKR